MAASDFGAAMHHCHVKSTSRRHIDRVLDLFKRGRAAGSRISLETYPYGGGSMAVGAYFLAPKRLPAWGASDIVFIETGQRIVDSGRLREIRAATPGAPCIVEYLDERVAVYQKRLARSFALPDAIVASDAAPVLLQGGISDTQEWPLPSGAGTHPRTAVTFVKTLHWMVRETATCTWSEAFHRCAYLPARVLDGVAAAMRRRGHRGVGANADLVVIDPQHITDRATCLDPTRTSVGVKHLTLAGKLVIRDSELLADAFPGQPIRGRRYGGMPTGCAPRQENS